MGRSKQMIALIMMVLSASAAQGAFITMPMTGDADSGVVGPQSRYTHAIDLNGEDNATVNGVVFSNTGSNFTLTGATSAFNNDASNVTGDIGDTLDDFFYTPTTGNAALTLTGLTPSTKYLTVFYGSGFGTTARSVLITPSIGTAGTVNENQYGDNNGIRILHEFETGAADTQITYNFDAVVNGDSFHFYAFSNELVPVPEPATYGVLLLGLGLYGWSRSRR